MSAAIRITPDNYTACTDAGDVDVAAVTLGGVPRGAIVVLVDDADPAVDGIAIMNLLATHGYDSLAADPGTSTASRQIPARGEAVLSALAAQLTRDGWETEQIGLLGVGSGARVVFEAATRAQFGAAASLGLDGSVVPAEVLTPWLGLAGAVDDAGVAGFDRFGARTAAMSEVYTEVVAYQGVDTSFYRDLRESATHAAAFDAWQRVVEWLDLRVAPPPTPLARSWAAARDADVFSEPNNAK